MRDKLLKALAERAREVEEAIGILLPKSDRPEAPLFEAMRYACMDGGKRLRPFMVLESAALFGVSADCALRTASAIEFIHSYSLIHDDLPAMDDAKLRRGKSTVHMAFDEATAILAGDALLALAFEILSHPDTHEDPSVRIALVATAAKAAGPRGMVGGQMLDMIGERVDLDVGTITRLQRLKTSEMIAAACESGAILGRAPMGLRFALRAFAGDLGLAFQIIDDLLDVEGDEIETGKTLGRDDVLGKATFVSILGVERARSQAELLARQSMSHLNIFGERANLLKEIVPYILERRR